MQFQVQIREVKSRLVRVDAAGRCVTTAKAQARGAGGSRWMPNRLPRQTAERPELFAPGVISSHKEMKLGLYVHLDAFKS